MLRALVGGCFSFENGHTTAGDLLACEVVCDWLREAGVEFDVAKVPGLGEGIDWATADPATYSHAIYVCGPFERGGELESRFLLRFGGSRLIGVDLTMLTPLEEWNPFDLLIERDSTRTANPDITFASTRPKVPVVGVCLVEDYPGAAVAVAEANAAIEKLMAASSVARVDIDTRLDENGTGLRSAAEVESLFARMDVVVTTRLHGMVLSLKNGVPVVAIDPERGGAKVQRQARVLDWPVTLPVDAADETALRSALAYCLTEEGRERARECGRRAAARVDELRRSFVAEIGERSPRRASQVRRAAATVSVVIRDLGNEAWLAEALRSVRAQSHAALEIIVVGAGDSAYSAGPRDEVAVRHVSAPAGRIGGRAIAAARNAGATASRGTYLLFMESDERLLPQALRTGLNCFHLYPECAFVHGRCRDIDVVGRARDRYVPPSLDGVYGAALAGHPPDGPAILYRRDAFEAAGRFDEASDGGRHDALCLRVAAIQPARDYEDVVAERRIHEGSACLRAGAALRARLKAIESHWPLVKGHPVLGSLVVDGIRRARIAARTPLLDHACACLSAGRCLDAAKSLVHLVGYVPAWIGSFRLQLRARGNP
jgi:hypothetical protein